MMREIRNSKQIIWMCLLGLILLTACSHDDDGDKPLQMVKTQFGFSLPLKGTRLKNHTRMGGDVVQTDNTFFRGIDDIQLLCFRTGNSDPSSTDRKIGDIIEFKSSDTSDDDITPSAENKDYSQCQEIRIPITTDHFSFYATAALDAPLTTHAQKMQYGIIEKVGLSKGTYQDNSTIRFRPVSICTSTEPLGGSAIGQNLLALLNDLMSTTYTPNPDDNTADPNDPNYKWSTVNSLYLNEAYQRMTQLTTLSSFNVQTMLTTIYRLAQVVLDGNELLVPDNQGMELAQTIVDKIADPENSSILYTEEGVVVVVLNDKYQGFPEDLGLPAGSARIRWDAEQGKYVIPETHTYGTAINVSSLSDYVYPMSLEYQVISDILASDELIIQTDPESDPNTFNDWNDVIDEYNDKNASKSVETSTQSVVMVDKVNYAVGRMAIRVRLDKSGGTINDAKGHEVDITNGFTLKGIIVGGQREVDYDFQPVAGSKTYAIYDSYLNGGTQNVQNRTYTDPADYILGLGTADGAPINLALELVNECHDFQGADGVIAKGATFYLVAVLNPELKMNTTDVNKIFDRDYATDVSISIKSLASATYGLPDLDLPHPAVGISVNLSWEEGLWYDEVVLSRYANNNN